MENKEKEGWQMKCFWLFVALIISVIGFLGYISGEGDRYTEKRDAWFNDKMKTALLLQNSKEAEEKYYIEVEETKSKSDAFWHGREVTQEEAHRVRQSARNDFYDRVVK